MHASQATWLKTHAVSTPCTLDCGSKNCLPLQTQAYLSQQAGVASGSNLYVIWIGANDYLNNNVNRSMGEAANVSMVTGAIGQIMTNLYNSGARE